MHSDLTPTSSGQKPQAISNISAPASVQATAPGQMRVIKRNGTVVPYDDSKIAVATMAQIISAFRKREISN